jgi:hypothetical protein
MNKDKTHSSNEVLIPFANPIAIGLLISWFAHSSHRQMASRIQPKQRILLVFSDVFELFWPTACMEQRCYLITHKEAFAMIKNNYSYLSQWHKFSWKSISDSWSLKFCDFVTRNHRAEKPLGSSEWHKAQIRSLVHIQIILAVPLNPSALGGGSSKLETSSNVLQGEALKSNSRVSKISHS